MVIDSATAWIESRKGQIAVSGLGLMFLAAGVSKFLVTDLWIGFEPGVMLEILDISSRQFTLLTGAGEALLGLWILSIRRTFHASMLASLWLLAITIQMIRLEAWTLAIRDMGLFFYALTVLALFHSSSS